MSNQSVLKCGMVVALVAVLIGGICNVSIAQSKKDTLSIARQLRTDKKYKASIDLLGIYIQKHPKNMDAKWLLAQTLYWDKQINPSKAMYEKAMTENPTNYYLKLDYAKMLVDLGELDKAQTLLNTYITYDATSADALIALAKIAYLKKDNNLAIGYIKQALDSDPKVVGAFLFGNRK